MASENEKPQKAAASAGFRAHLEKIRAAKQSADEIMEKVSPAHAAAQAVIKAAWELLFDFFCEGGANELGLSELNTLSGVIQKLAASNAQIKNIEIKDGELRAQGGGAGGKITDEIVSQIEERLRLL